jgi:hypothetical protein
MIGSTYLFRKADVLAFLREPNSISPIDDPHVFFGSAENCGVASVCEVARMLLVDEYLVRRWAAKHRLPKVGSTYAFDRANYDHIARERDTLGENTDRYTGEDE